MVTYFIVRVLINVSFDQLVAEFLELLEFLKHNLCGYLYDMFVPEIFVIWSYLSAENDDLFDIFGILDFVEHVVIAH